ncbi:very short patch repair endonuclease [Neobacillus ginsengisoli]|uniref:Very short patch repair endonuclease n=1 Tax=Neobacillus ginsengisoli TaxID=904295 RepID=A0ABT9XNH2_9BACI|nr:very short patch repair endonuclease [Neobacillus ginsengisoli]MDQ0197089.1 DNA mismatch endonuclease (patch repair protein) [Neobacillus ginsengisoli]
MADKITKEQRSSNMKAIKSISKLENRVSKALWEKGIRFRKNSKLFGKPDISIQKYKIVIFIDSCFWHVCPLHSNMPKSNQDYWIKKLNRNQERDKEVNEYYYEKGWHLLRVWEHELKEDFSGMVDKLEQFINQIKHMSII